MRTRFLIADLICKNDVMDTMAGNTNRKKQSFDKEGVNTMRSLVLYKKETCPFCRKVMGFISSTGRTDVLYRDIVEDLDAADELVRVGGKRQVPCLFIDGKPMYESLDIIRWLEENPEEKR